MTLFDHNELNNIDSDAFNNLENLESLDLSWNKLSKLESLAFKSLKKLENLNLTRNPFLTTFNRSEFLEDLKNVKVEF